MNFHLRTVHNLEPPANVPKHLLNRESLRKIDPSKKKPTSSGAAQTIQPQEQQQQPQADPKKKGFGGNGGGSGGNQRMLGGGGGGAGVMNTANLMHIPMYVRQQQLQQYYQHRQQQGASYILPKQEARLQYVQLQQEHVIQSPRAISQLNMGYGGRMVGSVKNEPTSLTLMVPSSPQGNMCNKTMIQSSPVTPCRAGSKSYSEFATFTLGASCEVEERAAKNDESFATLFEQEEPCSGNSMSCDASTSSSTTIIEDLDKFCFTDEDTTSNMTTYTTSESTMSRQSSPEEVERQAEMILQDSFACDLDDLAHDVEENRNEHHCDILSGIF